MSITNMSDLIAVKGDSGEVLGKLLYFSLANVQIERDKLAEICHSLDNGEFTTLRMFSQELQIKARRLDSKKCA